MVGYMMEAGVASTASTVTTFSVATPPSLTATRRKLKFHNSLYKYATVDRIHLNTFQILPSETAVVTGSSPPPLSTSSNASVPLWNWSNKKVELLGDGWEDWSDTVNYMNKQQTEDEEECVLIHDWQKTAFPTCNPLHEQDSKAQLTDPNRLNKKFLLGSGCFRDVWLLERLTNVNTPVETTVLKTIRMKHDMNKDDLDRHRRDALVSERLQSSPYVLDIYAYCGNSAVYEYANGGSLYDLTGAKEYRDEALDEVAQFRFQQWNSRRKFIYAWQTVSAVADLHDIDHDGLPSVAHDDVDITQFVTVNAGKTFKLSDFNGAQFIEYEKNKEGKYEVCPFNPNMKGGKIRSPEEYLGEDVTEKMDIFALGNVLYTILTGQYPFYKERQSKAIDMIKEGQRPPIDTLYENSDDELIQAIIKAIRVCWEHNPEDRASAVQVRGILEPYARLQ